TSTCTGYEQKKPLSESMKVLKIHIDPARVAVIKHLEVTPPRENSLELKKVKKIDSLSSMALFSFECYVNISTIEKSFKEITEELVETIEDAKEFSKIYNRQKQLHLWWTELGKKRYKHDDNVFESAIKWLNENQYKIILKPCLVHALAFTTGLYEHLKEINANIDECGIN
ncbi:15804_t:CDS:2, partial [Gigaspora rosea]